MNLYRMLKMLGLLMVTLGCGGNLGDTAITKMVGSWGGSAWRDHNDQTSLTVWLDTLTVGSDGQIVGTYRVVSYGSSGEVTLESGQFGGAVHRNANGGTEAMDLRFPSNSLSHDERHLYCPGVRPTGELSEIDGSHFDPVETNRVDFFFTIGRR